MRTFRRTSRRALAAAAASVLLAGSMILAGVTAGPASAASPYCGITWGSLPRQISSAGPWSPMTVTGVRAGQHRCFDRLVVDLGGRAGPYWVQYVDYVTMDGSGFIVPLEGGAKLQIVVGGGDAGRPSTYPPGNRAWLADVTGFRTLRQAAWGGEFEGHARIGLGVRARLPFRVFVLDGPGSGSRLVVDVAHRW